MMWSESETYPRCRREDALLQGSQNIVNNLLSKLLLSENKLVVRGGDITHVTQHLRWLTAQAGDRITVEYIFPSLIFN